ncbi:MAG: class I SAM-dependent methyltransferase, partial [Sulfuricella sp.]|nr:class I SAM-dependent methyltransferase [Sulfuricella sp.]
ESKILELLRLLGLADALKGSELPSRHEENIAILSVGCGAGKHEAALAGRFPNWSIVATDLEMPSIGTMASSNLEFRVSNILDWDESRDFDFVYSIECLEHIKDHALAFKHIANKVRPGGWLYLSVPFANRDEQMDEQLCKSEWENHQHYLPGFSDADLITLCRANGMEPVKITAIFNHEPRGTLTQLLGSMQRDYSSALPHIIALLALDVQWGHIPKNRNQSVGIRILAKKC